MKLTIDFETRSDIDLKTRGLAVYAEGRHTDVTILGVKVDDHPAKVWVCPNFRNVLENEIPDETLEELIKEANIIEAHNLAFEKTIWDKIMVDMYGFSPLPIEKLRCSAAQAAALALPRSLGEVGEVLKLPIQKDKKGYQVMLKLCKPKKKGTLIWNTSYEDFKTLADYCKIDCEAESLLDKAMIPLSARELEIWRLDQKINNFGIKVDLPLIDKLIAFVQKKEETVLNQINRITGGLVKSPRQIAASVKWLETKGVKTENLDKDAVSKLLSEKELPEDAKKFLEARQMLGKSSVSKLETMKDMACKDSRVRHTILYHGCTTGRFSAKGLQIHNYPRDSFDEKSISVISSLDSLEAIEAIYDNIFYVASKCLRGALIPDIGKEFLVGDYSAIEARITSWVAGQENKVDAYRKGVDVYKINAMEYYQKKYDEITKEERQVGKVMELSLGYQGYVAAFMKMAINYGVKIPEDKAKNIIMAWREANPNIVRFWKLMENCAIETVRQGKPISLGKVKFGYRKEPFPALHIRLPSGRLLTYFKPSIVERTDTYNRTKETLSYFGVDSESKKWEQQYTYGGSLTENIVQAIARDILCDAMLKLDKAGYNIAFHVHDEIVCEEKEGEKDIKAFEGIMAEIPEWAEGLPITVECWKGKRYRK